MFNVIFYKTGKENKFFLNVPYKILNCLNKNKRGTSYFDLWLHINFT